MNGNITELNFLITEISHFLIIPSIELQINGERSNINRENTDAIDLKARQYQL